MNRQCGGDLGCPFTEFQHTAWSTCSCSPPGCLAVLLSMSLDVGAFLAMKHIEHFACINLRHCLLKSMISQLARLRRFSWIHGWVSCTSTDSFVSRRLWGLLGGGRYSTVAIHRVRTLVCCVVLMRQSHLLLRPLSPSRNRIHN